MGIKRSPPICAYCGCENPQTVDHVPPKGIFPEPLPSDLITVPCCSACHSSTSADDEHFRNVLLSGDNLEHEPRAKQARHRVLRSIARPEARRTWEKFINSFEDIDVVSPGGVWVGRQPGIPIGPGPLRVITRIARGIYFHEVRKPLPRTHEVAKPTLDQYGHIATKVARLVGPFDQRTACGGMFSYGIRLLDGDEATGVWVGNFFDRAWAIAFFRAKTSKGESGTASP